MANEIIVDGLLDFSGGINSLIPPTVAAAQNPGGLQRNQLAWLTNATVRGTGITCRAGWQFLCRVTDGTTLYQGGAMYLPRAANPYLMLSIGGLIYQVRVDTDNSVVNLMPPGTQNPDREPQAFFQQAEEFMIIQAGDNLTLPLCWDGAHMRRSLGASINYGTITGNFVVPAVGGIVLVTLAAPYTGGNGQQVLINGKQYSVGAGNIVTQFATLKNIGDFSLVGTARPPGTEILALPNYVSTTVSVTKGTGFSFDIVMSTPYHFGAASHIHPTIYINGVKVFVNTQTDDTHMNVNGLLPGAAYTQLFNTGAGAGIALSQPQTAAGTLQTGFSTVAIGQSVTTLLSAPYGGPLNQPILISGAVYEVTAVGQPMIATNQVYLTNLGDTPGATVVAPIAMMTVAELPAATAMDYFMGRVWYAQGHRAVCHTSSGIRFSRLRRILWPLAETDSRCRAKPGISGHCGTRRKWIQLLAKVSFTYSQPIRFIGWMCL
jgi:hypothetical protein